MILFKKQIQQESS